MNDKTIEVTNCWALSGGLAVVEVKHNLKGIPQGTIITNGKEIWTIKKRVVFNHTSMNKNFLRTKPQLCPFYPSKISMP